MQINRILAASATAALVAGTSILGAAAQAPAQESSLPQLGSCLAQKNTLDIVLLMDESGSLEYEAKDGQVDKNKPGTDVEGNRVDAAQSFIDELVTRQEDTGVDVNVRIAGFGQDYKSGATLPGEYGEWINLDGGSASKAKDEIAAFKERTGEDYTNYTNALSGAYQDLTRSGSQDPCRMVVTFTDGDLTAADGRDGAEEELCRPGGVTDRLRAAGVTNVGIGLSAPHLPSDFSLFRSLTQGGGPCGTAAPNGAFFEASNVGGLFAAFHSALSTGNAVSTMSKAGDAFNIALDDSISQLRFAAIEQEDLGENAVLTLTAPNGEELKLGESGSATLQGAEVEWETITDPVLKTNARMTLADGQSWAGNWALKFADIDPNATGQDVFTVAELQPGLAVRVGGGEEGTVERNNEQDIELQLIDASGNPRPMQGTANSRVTFHPENGEPQVLEENLDLSSGSAAIPAAKIAKLPAFGRLEGETAVTTKGEPGTKLTPFLNASALSVGLQNLPKINGGIAYNAEETTVTTEVPVKGPGKVWLPEGSTVTAEQLPENIGTVQVASDHNSPDNALELQAGEEKTLPVTLTIDELSDGLVNGSVPLSISALDGADEASVAVPVEGSYTVPLSKGGFALGFILALLGALLIPLAILYAIRWITSTIPRQRFGYYRMVVDDHNGRLTYDGAPQPNINILDVNSNSIPEPTRSFSAGGRQFSVRNGNPNPLAASPVVADVVPSVSGGDGAHIKGKAMLPLAVQGEWMVAGLGGDRYEVIALPRLPMSEEEKTRLEGEISTEMLSRIEKLKSLEPAAPAAPAESAGPSSPAAPEQPQAFGPNFGGGSNSPFGPGNTNSPFGPGSSPFSDK